MDEQRQADRSVSDPHRARMLFAGIGAVASVALVLAYYLPGLDYVDDFGTYVFLLAVPSAAMVTPFLLLGLLLRVKSVWIVAGSLMFLLVGQATFDVFLRSEDRDPSVLVFGGTFFLNLIILFFATIIDVAIRGGRKARRWFSSSSPRGESGAPPS